MATAVLTTDAPRSLARQGRLIAETERKPMIKNDGHHPTAPDSKHGRWHYTAPLTQEAANTILLRLASDNEETVIPDGKGHYLDNKCFRVYTEHGGNLFAVHNFNGRYSIISIDAIEAMNLGVWSID
jgi:hypothetical protein